MNESGGGNNDPFVRARDAGFQSIRDKMQKAQMAGLAEQVGVFERDPNAFGRVVDEISGDLGMRNLFFEAAGIRPAVWTTTEEGWKEEVSATLPVFLAKAIIGGDAAGSVIVNPALNRIKTGSAEVLPNRGLSGRSIGRYGDAAVRLDGLLFENIFALGFPEGPAVKTVVLDEVVNVQGQIESGLSHDDLRELQWKVFNVVRIAGNQNLSSEEARGVLRMVDNYRERVGDSSFWYNSYNQAAGNVDDLDRLREKAGVSPVETPVTRSLQERVADARSNLAIAQAIVRAFQSESVMGDVPSITEDEARFAGSVYRRIDGGKDPRGIVKEAAKNLNDLTVEAGLATRT